MKKIICVIIAVLFVVSLSGCSKASDNPTAVSSTEHPTTSVAATPTPEKTTSEPTINPMPEQTIEPKLTSEFTVEQTTELSTIEPWMISYANVLRGNAEFYSADIQKPLFINQITDAVTTDESLTFTIPYFAMVDLDHDGIPEVVLWLRLGESNDFGSEILHYQNGLVYGYTLSDRQCYYLKTDGTFSVTMSGFEWGIVGSVRFTESAWYNGMIVKSDAVYDADGRPTGSVYFVNGERVTEDDIIIAVDEQKAKEDAAWVELTEDNVDKKFTP